MNPDPTRTHGADPRTGTFDPDFDAGLAAGPPLWMPWNYRAALTLRLSASPDLHVTATERTVSPDGLIA